MRSSAAAAAAAATHRQQAEREVGHPIAPSEFRLDECQPADDLVIRADRFIDQLLAAEPILDQEHASTRLENRRQQRGDLLIHLSLDCDQRDVYLRQGVPVRVSTHGVQNEVAVRRRNFQSMFCHMFSVGS